MRLMIARLPLPALAVVVATLFATVPASGRAQAAAAPPTPASAAHAPRATLSASEPLLVQGESEAEDKVPEPKIEHLVSEDSQVRIEETRVRGVATRIVVKSKLRGMGSYGILTRDPSQYPQDDHSAGQPSLNFGF
jgi:hypothetical protein